MKLFLRKIAIFSISIGVVLLLADWWISHERYDDNTTMYGVWNDVLQEGAGADLAVVGNSRACIQYSPYILDSVLGCHSYCLGVYASSVNQHLALYHLYKELYPAPRVVVFNIDKSTIGPDRRIDDYRYFPYFWSPAFRRAEFPLKHFSFAEKWIPMYRYCHVGFRTINQKKFAKGERGYFPNKRHFSGLTENELKIQKGVKDMSVLQYGLFLDYVREVLNDGARAVFVYAPFYYKTQQLVGQDPWEKDFFDSVAAKYRIPVIDYSRDSMCYDTNCFYNYTHMNQLGAEKFSRQLALDLYGVLNAENDDELR